MELVARIRRAFPDDPWPKEKHPPCEGVEEEIFQEQFCGRRWHEVDALWLFTLSIFGWVFTPEALAFFLPAYMVEDLENPAVTGLNLLSGPLVGIRGLLLEQWNDEQLSLLVETIRTRYQGDDAALDNFAELLRDIDRNLNEPRGTA